MSSTACAPNPSMSEGTLPAVPKNRTVRQKVRFPNSAGFQRELKRRVDEYFESRKLTPRDSPKMYLKTAIIAAWFLGTYLALLFAPLTFLTAIPLLISMGLVTAAIGFNIQHDGGHKAYSDSPTINRVMAYTMDFLGASSYLWNWKHNSFHHIFTNIDGLDEDIDMGYLGRLSPHQPRLPFHRFQHYYLWFLYGFITVKWNFLDDFSNVIKGRIASHSVPRPKNWDLLGFIGGKLIFLSWVFIIPMLVGHAWWIVLLAYLVSFYIQGVVISVVFQLAHALEEADFPLPDETTNRMDNEWCIHQVETTVDFSRKNPIWTWYLGGLNFQVEHHLFPKICHVHYPALAKIVEETSKEFGIDYQAHYSILDGVRSHYRHLRQLGMPATA